jgi:hypothetical protein
MLALVFVSLQLAATSAGAATTYQLQVSGECVEAVALRSAVTARLGYDPFADGAAAQLRVRVERDHAGLLNGTIELSDEQGGPRGQREVHAETARCEELASALALSISIAIDAERAREEPPEPKLMPAPEPEPPPEKEPEAPSKPAPVAPRREPIPAPAPPSWHFDGSLGAMTLVGIAPLPAFGASFDVRAGRGAWRVGVGARVAGAAQASVESDAKLGVRWMVAELSGCIARKPWELCALALGGDTAARAGDVDHPRTAHGAFVAGGARAGWVAPLSESLSLWVRLEGLGVLWPIRPQVDGQTVWSAPAVAGSLGAGLRVHFW